MQTPPVGGKSFHAMGQTCIKKHRRTHVTILAITFPKHDVGHSKQRLLSQNTTWVTANSDYFPKTRRGSQQTAITFPCNIADWHFEMEKQNFLCEAGADSVNCLGYVVALFVEVGRSRVRFPMVSMEIFYWHNPSGRALALGWLSPQQKWVPGIIPVGYRRPVRRADNLNVPIVLKYGSLNILEPSQPVQACNGIALPLR
jgi:hypothetical protein